jgi:hypothetical protein
MGKTEHKGDFSMNIPLTTLEKFYGVSTDYLLADRTKNRPSTTLG